MSALRVQLVELVTQYSNVINLNLTNRFGDTFFGSMNFGIGGSFILPIYTTDPVGPALVNGKIWYNSTSNTFKCYQNGAIKTFTVS